MSMQTNRKEKPMNIGESIDRPENFHTIDEREGYVSGVVFREGDEQTYKAVSVRANDVGAMVLGKGHLDKVTEGESGPVAGAWPAIVIRGHVYDPQGNEIEDADLLGIKGTTVVVPRDPGVVFQIIDACMTMVLTHEQMQGVSNLVRSMYVARGQQNLENPDELQPTVLEEQVMKAEAMARQRGVIPPEIQQLMDDEEMPEELKELMRALLQATAGGEDDENEEDIN